MIGPQSSIEPTGQQPETIPAATVIIFRQSPVGGPPELLMLERAANMRFAAGACVFPGGRVDPSDRSLAAILAGPGADPEDVAARVAGLRETLEETGLVLGVKQSVTPAEAADARRLLLGTGDLAPVLERFGWTLDLDRLVPFARWLPQLPRAFDTRFYLSDIGTGAVELAVDRTENSRLFWASAADTLDMIGRGEASAIFPTLRNLERLARHADFAAALTETKAIAPTTITPWQEVRDGIPHLVIPEGLGYPVTAQRLDEVRRG